MSWLMLWYSPGIELTVCGWLAVSVESTGGSRVLAGQFDWLLSISSQQAEVLLLRKHLQSLHVRSACA